MFNAMDINKMMGMWGKVFTDVPDMSKMMNMWNVSPNHNKDFNFNIDKITQDFFNSIEDLSEIGHVVSENSQALLRRNGEILQKHANQFYQLIKDVSTCTDPEAALAKQTNFMKQSFEHFLENSKEMAEIHTKNAMEIYEMVSKKIAANIDLVSPKDAKKSKKTN
jgi:phasin family protein